MLVNPRAKPISNLTAAGLFSLVTFAASSSAQELKKLDLPGNEQERITAVALPEKSGRVIVTGSERGTLRFWNAENAELVMSIEDKGLKDGIGVLKFSPDGKLLAAADGTGQIAVWEVAKIEKKDAVPWARLDQHTKRGNFSITPKREAYYCPA